MGSRSAVILSIRTGFVLAILAIMPMMALPPVSSRVRRLAERVLGTAGCETTGAARRLAEIPADEIAPELYSVDLMNVARQEMPEASEQVGLRPPEPAAGDSDTEPDRIRSVLDRLHRLGATYTRLESDDAGSFQFQCLIPIDNSVYSRTFEQSSREPELAMQNVLERVESWHRARNRRHEQTRTARRGRGGLP